MSRRCVATFYRVNLSQRYIRNATPHFAGCGPAPYSRPDSDPVQGRAAVVRIDPLTHPWSDLLTAKRRAEGPAVTRKPRRPGKGRPRLRRVVKWFLIVFVLVGFAIIFFCGNLGILIRDMGGLGEH